MKNIIDEFGQPHAIDETTRKLYAYSNKKKRATYCAQIVENGKHTRFWTSYISEEIVTDLEPKLRIFLSPVNEQYARMVVFNSTIHDPDNVLWNEVVSYVREHESDFFDEYGDFRRNVPVLKEVIPNWKELIR